MVTQNQIAYWNLVETRRANLAREGEQHRSNVAQESLTRSSQAETRRANIARETEAYRHNIEDEGIKIGQLYETNRANTAKEAEVKRANQASEFITQRGQDMKLVSDLYGDLNHTVSSLAETVIGKVLGGGKGLQGYTKKFFDYSENSNKNKKKSN